MLPLSVSVTDLQVTGHFSAWDYHYLHTLLLLLETLTITQQLGFYDDKLVILVLSNIENVNLCS